MPANKGTSQEEGAPHLWLQGCKRAAPTPSAAWQQGDGQQVHARRCEAGRYAAKARTHQPNQQLRFYYRAQPLFQPLTPPQGG